MTISEAQEQAATLAGELDELAYRMSNAEDISEWTLLKVVDSFARAAGAIADALRTEEEEDNYCAYCGGDEDTIHDGILFCPKCNPEAYDENGEPA